jgi:hypothetical protein
MRAPAMRAALPAAHATSTFVERSRRNRRWALNMSVQISPRRNIVGSYTACVRTRDGGFFPESNVGADSRADALRASLPVALSEREGGSLFVSFWRDDR